MVTDKIAAIVEAGRQSVTRPPLASASQPVAYETLHQALREMLLNLTIAKDGKLTLRDIVDFRATRDQMSNQYFARLSHDHRDLSDLIDQLAATAIASTNPTIDCKKALSKTLGTMMRKTSELSSGFYLTKDPAWQECKNDQYDIVNGDAIGFRSHIEKLLRDTLAPFGKTVNACHAQSAAVSA